MVTSVGLYMCFLQITEAFGAPIFQCANTLKDTHFQALKLFLAKAWRDKVNLYVGGSPEFYRHFLRVHTDIQYELRRNQAWLPNSALSSVVRIFLLNLRVHLAPDFWRVTCLVWLSRARSLSLPQKIIHHDACATPAQLVVAVVHNL